MSVIRKLKSGKWQVLIRKANQPHVIKSFFDKGTASKFAKETETLMDKGLYEDYITDVVNKNCIVWWY